MFSILAVSHGDTARVMVASARELTFCDAEIETVSIYAETSVADARAAILQKLDDLLARGDVVVLTDLKLGTPFNLLAELMQMPFMANMYRSLVPIWLEARILSLEQTVEYLRLHADTEGRIFLLFRTPESALQAWERGIRFSLLTLADKQYFPNKLEVPEPQKAAIRLLHAAGVTVAAQETPLSEMRLLETFEK